jgi:hypothetical protein
MDDYMNSYLNKINPGLKYLLINSILATFAFSFTPIFLKEKGFSLSLIILVFAIYAGVGVLFSLFVEVFYIKKFMMLGLFFQGVIALVLGFYSSYSIYLFVLFSGLNLLFFWVTLNYIFFKGTSKDTSASNSSWYIILPGVFGMIMPLLGAFVINLRGYYWMFILTFILYLISIFFVQKGVVEERVEAKTMVGIKKYKGLKTITLFEGALQFFGVIIIPAYSLLFFKTENQVGLFLSYLGVIGLIISIILAKKSDVSQQRKKYIYFLLICFAVSIFILSFAHTQRFWIIAVAPITMLFSISFPIRTAIAIDGREKDIHLWKTREIFLNIGRVISLSFASILFYYGLYPYVFVFYGLLMIPYILLVRYKLNHIN